MVVSPDVCPEGQQPACRESPERPEPLSRPRPWALGSGKPSVAGGERTAMWVRRNAAWLLGIALLAATSANGARARQAEAASRAAPDPRATMAAYRAVASWVREWSVPEAEQRVDPEGALGACVTLRLGGAVIGRGVDLAGDGATVWRAARLAALQAAERAPVERDALREERLRDLGARLTVDIQTAGALTPLPGETFGEAASVINPGVEGVAARLGDRLRAAFPGTMLASNTTPGQALLAATAEAGAGAEGLRVGVGLELAELARERGLIVYRFAVTHLAQPAPGQEPVFLFRGGRVIPATAVSAPSLARAAAAMANHLMSRRTLGAERQTRVRAMLGDYEPWSGRYEPLLATPAQQGLAALALSRFAGSAGVDAKDAAAARRAAWVILDDLAKAEGDRAPSADTGAAAMYIAALISAGGRGETANGGASTEHASARAAAERIRAAHSKESGWNEQVRPAARAVVAYALAQAALGAPGLGVTREEAEEAARSLLRETNPGEVVALLPWLGWAGDALWPAMEGAEAPHVGAMLDTRSLLWRGQLGPEDVGVDLPDLLGGVVFTVARTPLPTWQVCRPLAYYAGALADARLTPAADRAKETSRVLRALRFVMQLQVDDAAMHMFRDRDLAFGGVREALWNQKLTVDSTSMALLAVCGALDAAGRR